MRICIFASGSGGNCLLLSDGSTHVLVDAGISMRRIEASLREAGIAMSDITGSAYGRKPYARYAPGY